MPSCYVVDATEKYLTRCDPMPYPPAKRRQNLIYAACHRWVRDHQPAVYARIVKSAREEVPVLPPGRHPVPEPAPTVIVPVPVREGYRDRYRPLNTLRPMKRRQG